jgi:hypothetical protein
MATIADINLEARDLCDADTTSYPAATLLRRINQAYEQVVGWLIMADGTAQFDDTNYSDFPIGTYDLVDSQSVYSFNDKFLQVINVQVKDSNGDFSILKPIDQSEYSDDMPLSEAFETAGIPEYYDKLSDDSIKLYPSPSSSDVTLTAGLKIYFKRTADIYTSAEVTTGTKEPGFISTHHYILSYMAAVPYCMKYKKDRVTLYEKKIGEMKKELIELYSQKEKDTRKIMSMKQRLFK